MEYNHHKLPTVFIDFQQHFSSNGNKKAKFPKLRFVNTKFDIFNAQKNNVVYILAK